MNGEPPDVMSVRKVGLGYEGEVIAKGVSLTLDRIIDSRGEMHGELSVSRAPEGHLLRQRFNVSSMTSRTSTAKYLASRSNHIDWVDTLERFCVRVMDMERAPQIPQRLGHAPVRAQVPMRLWPMLPDRQPTILFGAEGSWKSTLAAAVACAVSTGVTPFEGWEVRQPKGPVLVLDWEADEEAWNDRLMGLVPAGAEPDVDYQRCQRPVTDLTHQVAALIAERGYVLVIVDSVGLATPQRHEGSDANESALRLFSVLRQWGITSLLIDHVAKDGDPRRPYGSMYKPAMARASWQVTLTDEPDLITLVHRKANDLGRQPDTTIRITRDEGVIAMHPASWVRPADERPLTGQVALIVDALREAGHALDEREIEEACGVEAARRVILKPQNRGMFTKVPGGWWLASVTTVTSTSDNSDKMVTG